MDPRESLGRQECCVPQCTLQNFGINIIIFIHPECYLMVMMFLGFMLFVMMVSVFAHFVGSNSGGSSFNLSHVDDTL